jgi:hypothetical protein
MRKWRNEEISWQLTAKITQAPLLKELELALELGLAL